MKYISIYKILTDITDIAIKKDIIPNKYLSLLDEIHNRLLSLSHLFSSKNYYRLCSVMLSLLNVISNIRYLYNKKEYNKLAIEAYKLEKYIYSNGLYNDINIACHIEYIKGNKNIDINKISKAFYISLSMNKECKNDINKDLASLTYLTDEEISSVLDDDMIKYINIYMSLSEKRIVEIYKEASENIIEA